MPDNTAARGRSSPSETRNRAVKRSLKIFLLELAVYSIAVAVYFFFVLHFLGSWLANLYTHNRPLYAAVALALIVGQGVLLEIITRTLVGFIQKRLEA